MFRKQISILFFNSRKPRDKSKVQAGLTCSASHASFKKLALSLVKVGLKPRETKTARHQWSTIKSAYYFCFLYLTCSFFSLLEHQKLDYGNCLNQISTFLVFTVIFRSLHLIAKLWLRRSSNKISADKPGKFAVSDSCKWACARHQTISYWLVEYALYLWKHSLKLVCFNSLLKEQLSRL